MSLRPTDCTPRCVDFVVGCFFPFSLSLSVPRATFLSAYSDCKRDKCRFPVRPADRPRSRRLGEVQARRGGRARALSKLLSSKRRSLETRRSRHRTGLSLDIIANSFFPLIVRLSILYPP